MKWWEARCIFLSVVVDLNDVFRMKDKIESSEQSVIKLKRHMESGTCPPDLRYEAEANIFPDEDFKSDTKDIIDSTRVNQGKKTRASLGKPIVPIE